MHQPDERSDAALLTAIGRGDRDALAEVYRRHAGAVYAGALRVLGDGLTADGTGPEAAWTAA